MRRVSWRRYFFPAAGLALFVPLLFFFDSPLLMQIQDWREETDWLIQFGSWIGRNNIFWPVIVGVYLIFTLLRMPAGLDRSFGVCASALAAGLVSVFIKFSLLRARPSEELGPFSFFHLEGILNDSPRYQSFPSGDTALVAGAAGYLFWSSSKHRWKWLLILLPLASAWARVSLNRHWPSDTLLSLGLGFLTAHILWKHYGKSLTA